MISERGRQTLLRGHGQISSMASAPHPRKRVLLVDDCEAVSRRMGELLSDKVPSLEVVCANTGERGFELATSEPFDLVLLDLRLPGRSGIDVLRELRSRRPSLPVVIVSSLPESPYSTLARRAGAFAFVTKSALVQDLERVVRSALAATAA